MCLRTSNGRVLSAVGGRLLSLAGDLVVDTYEKISVALPAATVSPCNWAAVRARVPNASRFNRAITCAPAGGINRALDGPLLVVGAKPVALLGGGGATLNFANTGAVDTTTHIFVFRNATSYSRISPVSSASPAV